MRNIKLSVLFFLMFLFFTKSFSQVSTFEQYSEDPVKFLAQVEQTFDYALMPKQDLKEYMTKFAALWNSPRYSENFKNATYNTFNLMSRKRVKILPNYEIYLNSVMNFIDSKQSDASFEAWQRCVVGILYNESVRNFTNFLEMSENLFLDNIFYKTLVYEYKSSNAGYKFEYDKEPKVVFSEMDITCYNSQRDSIMVNNTKGTYYPNDALFKGIGGEVYWKRVGLAENVVWAELRKFEIDLKRGGILQTLSHFIIKIILINL